MATQKERTLRVLSWLREVWPGHAPPGMANPCILAARAGIEVGAAFGVALTAVPVDIAVMNGAGFDAVLRDLPADQYPPHAATVGAVCEDRLDRAGNGWPGHLVLRSHDWVADLTGAQFARPDHGINMDGWVLPAPGPGLAEWWFGLEGGGRMRLAPRAGISAYRRTPAWQHEFKPVAARIVEQVTAAETQARAMLESQGQA